MYKMHFVGLTEGPINISNEKYDKEKGITVQIKPLFRCKVGKNVMGMQLSVQFSEDKRELFSYAIVATYYVEDGKDIVASIEGDNYPEDLIKQMLSSALDVMRGAMAIVLRNSSYNGVTIPSIDIDEIYRITGKEKDK
jgi:HD superfamily phosphohydrolase